MESELLLQTLSDMRNDLRVMEERLGKRIDNIQPQFNFQSERIGKVEQSVIAMDAQRKTILSVVAFAGSVIGVGSAYILRFLLGH